MAVKIRVGVNMAKKILKFRKRSREKRKLAKELIQVLQAEGERYYRNHPQSKVIPFPREPILPPSA